MSLALIWHYVKKAKKCELVRPRMCVVYTKDSVEADTGDVEPSHDYQSLLTELQTLVSTQHLATRQNGKDFPERYSNVIFPPRNFGDFGSSQYSNLHLLIL